MSTIFITIYDGDTEKNVLRSDIFPLLKKANLKIILLVRKSVAYYKKNFEDSQTIVEFLAKGGNFLEKIFYWLGWNTIPTFSISLLRKDRYLKHRNFIRFTIEKLLSFLGRSRRWRNFLRWIYFHIPDNYGKELFLKYKPDLLFAPNMFSPEDSRLLRHAKKLKIKTLTSVKSWDVLTTKAFTRMRADKILVFNQHNRKEAITIGDYKPEQIALTGFPQFDIYRRKEVILPREDFFKKIGADIQKKLILYTCSGDWKAPYDYEVLLGLFQAMREGKIIEPVQVLVRFHPKYSSKIERAEHLPDVLLDRPGIYLSEDKEQCLEGTEQVFDWAFTNEDIAHLANSLFHTVLVINTESTMTLEAAAFDKPVIMIGYDGFQELDYWHSVIRKYDQEHFQNILKTGGARLVKSRQELVKCINNYLKNPSLDEEGRKRLRDEMLYKLDGKSGERAARVLLEMLNN